MPTLAPFAALLLTGIKLPEITSSFCLNPSVENQSQSVPVDRLLFYKNARYRLGRCWRLTQSRMHEEVD